MPVLTRLFDTLKHALGLDRAIAYTVIARFITIVGSTGTVLLIVHFLSPVEQGYYYALLSLVALQTVFELGFSFVIQQLAAHEGVHLVFFPDGSLTGSLKAQARLASIFQLMVRWYGRAAAVMVPILLIGGWLFFSHRHTSGDRVAWQLPFCLAAIACSATFLLGPFYSFLDGCGEVREVAALRMREGIASLVMAWISMFTHHGLYSPAMVIIGQAAVGSHFIWKRRRMLHGLYHFLPGENAVSWREEILPFQWRIGISWLCLYFTFQALIPILFSLRGPVEAGQMGMSLAVTGYLWATVIPWMSTKATPFGNLIAKREFARLDALFFSTLKQSLLVLAGIIVLVMAAIIALQYVYPKLAVRMVSPYLFALLLLSTLSMLTIQNMAIYLRAHKLEPFLGQSTLVAALTLGGAFLFVPRWGPAGAVVTYFVSTGIIGLVVAIIIFQRIRKKHHLPEDASSGNNPSEAIKQMTAASGDTK